MTRPLTHRDQLEKETKPMRNFMAEREAQLMAEKRITDDADSTTFNDIIASHDRFARRARIWIYGLAAALSFWAVFIGHGALIRVWL